MIVDHALIEQLLKQDPVWSAYALADLEPVHQDYCTWSIKGSSLLLVYTGLEPPILFAMGKAGELAELLSGIPGGRYQFSCLPEHFEVINHVLEPQASEAMWRMKYDGQSQLPAARGFELSRLNRSHLAELDSLFIGHSDAPDAFASAQLNAGIFYGIRDRNELVAVAGTHVCSAQYKVAAIGNVFTHPAHRGKGFASATAGAVVRELLAKGIETIVLNVARTNLSAIKTYKRIGFRPHREYYEGYVKHIKR